MISEKDRKKLRENHKDILRYKRAIKALHKDVGYKAFNKLIINNSAVSAQVDIMFNDMTPLTSYHLLKAAGDEGKKVGDLITYSREDSVKILKNSKNKIPRHIPQSTKWAFEDFANARGYTTDNIYKVGPVIDFDTKKPHYIRWPSNRLSNTVDLDKLGGWHKHGSSMRVVAAEEVPEISDLGTKAYRVARYNKIKDLIEISYIARYSYTNGRGSNCSLDAETKLERSLMKRLSTLAAHKLKAEVDSGWVPKDKLTRICSEIGRGANSNFIHENFHYSELPDVLRLLSTNMEEDSYQWHTGIAVLKANIIPEDS